MSDQTDGEYSVIVTETPPNGGPPMHVHTHEDELFYVLKGNYTFLYGNEVIYAKQGDFIRLPKGVPHRFINKDTITGVTMNTITPGGFENFFIEISKYSEAGTLSKPVIDSIAGKYGIEFLKK
ncbi:cupin domain-containing protein [Aquimarina sp. 2201CG1-2-11]|uniref:cupin domain-containing protein n=1 Tax=Aquimarina discodermiae TaxID=3231043 RepID=UPI0034618F6F